MMCNTGVREENFWRIYQRLGWEPTTL